MSNKILISPPHMSGREQKYIQEAFDKNWVAPAGGNITGFETELAAYNNVNAASVVSSGTAAIHLAFRLLDIGPGDTVFCSSLTFVASANPILYQGGTPVFIDSERESWNMSPQALKRAFVAAEQTGKLPKAVIVVHLYGQSAKVDEILRICENYDVPLIEDAAESLGSTYKGQMSGTHGKYGIYSFNGNKIITTSGGGAIVSNDTEAINKSRFLATQAREPVLHYEHEEIGYNYRMSNIVAGIGRGQLEVLDKRVKQRRAIFNRYKEALNSISGVQFQPELENTMSNRWLTALTIDPEVAGVTRTEVIKRLTEEDIEARPVWKPMHLQPLFAEETYFSHELGKSISDDLFENGLCLPSGSNMTKVNQEKVINTMYGLLFK